MFERFKKIFGSSNESAQPPAPPPEAPFEFLAVPGAAAADAMKRAAQRAGIFPVLMGDREEFGRVVEVISANEDDFESIKEAGLRVDVDAWIKERVQAEPESYDGGDLAGSAEESPVPPLSPARDILTGKFRNEVFIGLLPVPEPWLVPAYLKTGGWNECPPPEVHVAFFHRWHQRYGAVVTTVTDDIIEFAVARPPQSAGDALALAQEQFVYCSDIVHQGVGSVGNLAATLRGSSNWYFWWD